MAAVSGAVGVFTVLRAQSFTGHSLSDVGATGGSAAYLIGLTPLVGFVAAALLAAWMIELIGLRNARGRDLAMGVVLGGALGLAALFLYLDTTHTTTTGAAITILFGSLFVLPTSSLPAIVGLSAVALAIVLVLHRQLLLSALGPELAAAQGVSVRRVGLFYLLALALAVALSALAIGAVLGTALLIGPPATALRLTKRPTAAMAGAALIGVGATWLGILLAYDSYNWPPAGHGWPVSFLIVALVFGAYLAAQLAPRRDRRHESAPSLAAGASTADGAA